MSNKYILNFLRELNENNNREWFAANKETYNIAVDFFKKEVAELIVKISQFDPEIKYLTPENCVFRIYRDIRFSPDKTPYKTHFGAYMAAGGGRKSPLAGYYFHFAHNEVFLSGGIYCPEKDTLKAVRKAIDANFDELNEIASFPDFKKYFDKIIPFEQTLSKVPAGFSADSPAAEWLKFKNFGIHHFIDEQTLCNENFTDYAAKVFAAMKNFNEFFNEIIREIKR
ncbi:MAG: DUF2461 domain-containing protein [Prevotellaceae bacterium]|jgi:uncharacterized protein (TIGR02453 family)|nr:DUF2461 domain-containing protein [Prevotellaceae bacterium]